MNRATFFKHFELLADQPDGVAKMRELVLELAVRGKLVPQDSADDPASVYLESILSEKQNGRKQTVLPEIADEEIPYDLPTGWAFVRNTQIISLRKGKKPKTLYPEPKGLPYLDIAALDRNEIRQYTDDVSCPQVTEAHLIIVCDGSRSGLVMDGKSGVLGSTLAAIESRLNRDFLKLLLLAAYESMNSNKKGAAIPHLDIPRFMSQVIGVPPVCEQRRIVAKVDELMALCDELEQRRQARQHARGQLQQSALHHLLDAREPQTFAAAWQRVRDHFHLLHDTPDAIPKLRQAILQLAVHGCITEQKPADGNAAGLLQTIAKDKEKLVKAKKLKARQSVEPVEISPSVLPENWAWCRLAGICLNITDGFHNTPKSTASGVRYITAQHIRPNVIDFENGFFVSEADHQELVSKTKPKKGDILVVNIGAGSGTAAIINVDFEFSFKNVAILNKHDSIDSAYLYYVMIESRAATFDELTKGGAQPFLSLGVLRNILVPLPPLAEQKRIVARVEELLRWCDTLEAQLHQTRTLGAHLLASTLHHLLAA